MFPDMNLGLDNIMSVTLPLDDIESVTSVLDHAKSVTSTLDNAYRKLFGHIDAIEKHLTNKGYWEAIGKAYGARGWATPVDYAGTKRDEWIKIKDDVAFDDAVAHHFHDGIQITRFDDAMLLDDITKDFFKQSFKAAEAELYHPALTSLTAIFDGLLAIVAQKVGYDKNKNTTKFIKRAEALSKNSANDDFAYTYSRLVSLETFVKDWAVNKDFNDPINDSPFNRNWLMHGRTREQVDLINYLKLLSFVDVLIDYNKILTENELEPATHE